MSKNSLEIFEKIEALDASIVENMHEVKPLEINDNENLAEPVEMGQIEFSSCRCSSACGSNYNRGTCRCSTGCGSNYSKG